ncbi:SixA phosphatase family protein [Neisseria shayeganii]|nr:phosphoglycerate mutase family protein [Neisseria shayeganii]
MNLILWRHAEAEEGHDDLQRRLTEKGHAQAQAAARWLRGYLPEHAEVWASEALRSQETAAALGLPYRIVPALNPVNAVEKLPALLHSCRSRDCIVWVGHQPWIGQLCAYLLNRRWTEEPYWSVKKSGIWWFELHFDAECRPQAKLKAAVTPQMLPPGQGET